MIPQQAMLQPGQLNGMGGVQAGTVPGSHQSGAAPGPQSIGMRPPQPGAPPMPPPQTVGNNIVPRPAQPPLPTAPPPAAPPPMPQAPPPQPNPQQSLEQQSLAGGGNKQQISNLMTALGNVGAGSNNGFMGSGVPQQQAIPDLVHQVPQALPPGQLNPMGQQQQASVQPGQMGMGGFAGPPSQGGQQIHPGVFGGFGQFSPPPQPQPAMGQAQPYPPLQQPMGPPYMPPPQALVSDERAKEAVESAQPSLRAFLDSIGAHNYQYKDPARDGFGTFTSPMAQELEKTPLGKQAVIDTPRGKMVDYARLGGVNLAAVSVVHREQEKLRAEVRSLRAAIGRRK